MEESVFGKKILDGEEQWDPCELYGIMAIFVGSVRTGIPFGLALDTDDACN
jgi:hypothetical protein